MNLVHWLVIGIIIVVLAVILFASRRKFIERTRRIKPLPRTVKEMKSKVEPHKPEPHKDHRHH